MKTRHLSKPPPGGFFFAPHAENSPKLAQVARHARSRHAGHVTNKSLVFLVR